MDLTTLASDACLDRFGSWDYAVPMDWLMADPEKRRPHVWFYPSAKKRGNIFGRPLKWSAIARLSLRMQARAGVPRLDNYLRTWAFAHPGKGLSATGIKAVRDFLASNPTLDERHIMRCVIDHYEIPAPPPGTIDAPREEAA